MKKTFTYTDDKSSKFWSIAISGKSFTVNYGKTGTNGQTQTKEFDTEEKCQKEADKLIAEKTKKGYVEEVAASSATKPAAPKQKHAVLNDDTFTKILTIVEPEDAEEKYNISGDIKLPYLDFYGGPDAVAEDDDEEAPPKVCIYNGDLKVRSIETGMKSDYAAFSLVVDGNLAVDENIDWGVELDGCFLIVTGNLTCKNLFMSGVGEVVVKGNLIVENGILGHYGDDGGFLDVKGDTTAQTIVNTTYFNMSFGNQPKAIIIGDPGRTHCTVDYSDEFEYDEDDKGAEPLLQILEKKYWEEDGTLNDNKIAEAFLKGKSIFKKSKITIAAVDKRLLVAVEKNDKAAVEKLIAEGADLNCTNSYKSTPLAQACLKNYEEIAMMLIDAGADTLLKDKYKQYPLQLAAENGGHEAVKRLLAMGSPVNGQSSDGSTALKWAAEQGHFEIVKTLIAAGADANIKDGWKEGPLEAAKKNKHKDIVDYLEKLK
nr:ankyrin repeat domain-containing protein [Flavobacterium sp. ASV13]